jgi:hypothetical protein
LASDLTDTALANRHRAAIDEREDAQAARYVALQRQRTHICATTLVSWWPQHSRKQQGPGRNWYQKLFENSKRTGDGFGSAGVCSPSFMPAI